MTKSQHYQLSITLAVAAVIAGAGCRSDEPAPQEVPRTVLRLPVVAPQSDVKSLEVTPTKKSFIAGDTIRVEGEYDINEIPTPPKIVMVEIGDPRRGKWIIMQTAMTRDTDNGQYAVSIKLPEKVGEYELHVRTRDQFIGRSRITAVESEGTDGSETE